MCMTVVSTLGGHLAFLGSSKLLIYCIKIKTIEKGRITFVVIILKFT